MNKIYYKRADCCVLVYDITDSDSFDLCKDFYKKEILDTCKKGIKVILVGNKTDLENERKVSKKEAAKFAKKNDYYFKETSCENNLNVADAFETIIIMTNNDMMKIGKQNLEEKIDLDKFKVEQNNMEKGVDIEALKTKQKKKRDCCIVF